MAKELSRFQSLDDAMNPKVIPTLALLAWSEVSQKEE